MHYANHSAKWVFSLLQFFQKLTGITNTFCLPTRFRCLSHTSYLNVEKIYCLLYELGVDGNSSRGYGFLVRMLDFAQWLKRCPDYFIGPGS